MYAVIRTGGKQYRVQEGQSLKVERIEAAEGDFLEFTGVLMIADGAQITVGAPYVDGGKVTAMVKAQGRGRKVEIIKFRRRKNYRRRMGHRQYFTELHITGITSSATATQERFE